MRSETTSSLSARLRTVALGLCALGVLLLPAAGARALSFPSDVYLLPTSDPVDVDLSADPRWIRLHPISPSDPGPDDYTATVSAGTAQTVSGLTVVPLTFSITWNGTKDAGTPFFPADEQLLFVFVDSRQGSGMSLATTVDVPNSGIQRGSVSGDLLGSPVIVGDAYGTGFLNDAFGSGFVGVYLNAVTTTQTITWNWVLDGSLPTTGNVWIANAMFALPEPGTAALFAGGLLALAVRRRRARS